MAGVLKVRDADGTLRTIVAIKVRDGETVRTIQSASIRDTDGTARVVFATGAAPSPDGAYITPPYRTYSGKGYYRSASFTASHSVGTPTSFAWGVLEGNGTVIAGADAATATLQVFVDPDDTQTAVFFCDMVVADVAYQATCQLTYSNLGSGSVALR